MDLSTVKKKLDEGKYSSYQAFFDDIQLIWNNCKTYNISESEIYMMAEECQKLTHNLIQSLKKELGLNLQSIKKKKDEISEEKSDDEESGVTFEQRIAFAD